MQRSATQYNTTWWRQMTPNCHECMWFSDMFSHFRKCSHMFAHVSTCSHMFAHDLRKAHKISYNRITCNKIWMSLYMLACFWRGFFFTGQMILTTMHVFLLESLSRNRPGFLLGSQFKWQNPVFVFSWKPIWTDMAFFLWFSLHSWLWWTLYRFPRDSKFALWRKILHSFALQPV